MDGSFPFPASQIKDQLHSCLATHVSCRTPARLCSIWCSDNMHIIQDLDRQDLMPRRLLAFGEQEDPSITTSTDRADAESVILVLVDAKADPFPYVALSHRWGSNETCKAVQKNVQELQTRGIRYQDVPKTYRDAIEVTRQLGYSHLWIDSLCIIQDDAEDWKEEARRMAVIYGNAVCTIAAMDAQDNEGGLFIREMPDMLRGNIESRGWVMQERMISPRSLLFTRNAVFWECRESEPFLGTAEQQQQLQLESSHKAQEKEESKLGMEHSHHPKQLFAFFRDFRLPGFTLDESQTEFVDLNLGLHGEPSDYEPILKAWWTFVELYSQRRLTFAKDKFLAINGIASVSQRWTQMKNSFGLWYHFMEDELLWCVEPGKEGKHGQEEEEEEEEEEEGEEEEKEEKRRPTSFLAPSWTWASLTSGCRVVNRYYSRLPARPRLMLKPQIRMPVGTSFDQALPIPAWMSQDNRRLELTGDLRVATVTARSTTQPRKKKQKKRNKSYHIQVDRVGRRSDDEAYHFFPDDPSEFPVDEAVACQCLYMVHYAQETSGMDSHVDVYLVLVQARREAGEDGGVQLHEDWKSKEELRGERTMRRVGYLEVTYSHRRDAHAVWEDSWWRWVELV